MNTDQLHADTRSCGEMSCEECNERTEALRNEIARLTAELAALREEREWRPIATAPKDGTGIQAFFPQEGGFQSVVRWGNYENWSIVIQYLAGCDDHSVEDWQPTHWLPLPQPPTLAADVKEGV